MTYAHAVDVAATVEMYEALHAEIVRQSGGTVDGLLVHIGHPSPTGFRVVEVWESRTHFERYNDEIVLPAIQRMAAGQPGPAPEQTIEPLDVRGLVLAGGQVVV
jgi:hypothetical protein